MIKNVVFDFGNVLSLFKQEHILGSVCTDKDDMRILQKAIFTDWNSLDEGYDYDEFIEKTKKELPERLHVAAERVFNEWHTCLIPVEGMAELIAELKSEGYHIYLLSNAPTFLGEHIDYFDEISYFDGVVISGAIKMAKPNREIYEHLFEKFSLVPSECIFVDDL
ncbi:MAG: HAD-IA family hydrolase, partial [Oscillospiraceae bacterium]